MCVLPLCGHPVWVLFLDSLCGCSVLAPCVGALRGCSVWVLCVGTLCGQPVWVLCVGTLCGQQVFLRQLMGDRLNQQYKVLTERCVLGKALVYRWVGGWGGGV